MVLLLLEGQSFAWAQNPVRVVLGVGARFLLRVHDGSEPFYLRHCFVKRANVCQHAAFLLFMLFEIRL